MTEGVFEVGQLIRLRSGKCLLRVEGWADVEGEPRKLRVELEFQLRQIRARVRPLEVADATESMCPCEHIELVG